jgi:hypothetical protein
MEDRGFAARVLADSVSPAGIRLTTLEVRFPRFILSEFNTHRMFCLDGDVELYFDMPSYEKAGGTKRFAMTLREFHDKWHNGAAPRRNRSRAVTAERANIPRVAINGQPYRVRGLDFANWLYDPARSRNRQPIREQLAAMNLRSCDERTGEIYHTHVRDVCYSGRKDVYRVVLEDGREILSTKDHQFLTRDGWQRLEDAVGLELSKNGIASWSKTADFAMNGIDKYRNPEWLRARRAEGYSARAIADMAGVTIDQVKKQFHKHKIPFLKARVRRGAESHLWRGGVTPARRRIGQWTQREAFRTHRSNGFRCVLCGSERNLHAHHLDPVVHNPARACDPANLTTLCRECHGELHQRNIELVLLEFIEAGGVFAKFWEHVGGMRLRKLYVPKKKRARVRHFVGLERIEYVGERETYDIEVDGPYHNFVANGFIVHNSRNSASSRAIPTKKLIERVLEDPAMPVEWGVNKAGMSASEILTEEQAELASEAWLRARDSAVERVREMQELSVHKQVINRILEPYMWHTVIVTATEWENFFTLRLAENAQPEIQVAARVMFDAKAASDPTPVALGAWHLPLVQEDERSLPIEVLKKVSAARCARVSYLTHDGKRDIEKDIELCDRLWSDRHLSPFEHVATPPADTAFHANFRGWIQMRKELETAAQ